MQNKYPGRWCEEMCSVHPADVCIPLKVVTANGDEIEVASCPTHILWPWDFFHYMWKQGKFLEWVADDPATASDSTESYWKHCSHLDFFQRLGLDKNNTDQLRSTVPLFFHTDGVKIYKAQKAWVYSVSSACRKGASLETKLVIIILRDSRVIKEKSHDAVGELMGYITDTLMSGCFPRHRPDGAAFPTGSAESHRAGKPFAGKWAMAFSGFKGDWEARMLIHKSKRGYNSTWVCDHCMASRLPQFTFGDFNMDAGCLSHRFTHEEYMILQGSQQSSWRFVKGWTKDRNLEDSHRDLARCFLFKMSKNKGRHLSIIFNLGCRS